MKQICGSVECWAELVFWARKQLRPIKWFLIKKDESTQDFDRLISKVGFSWESITWFFSDDVMFEGIPFQEKLSDHSLFTNASWSPPRGPGHQCGFWSPEDNLWNSNFRELKAVHQPVLNFLPELGNFNLLIFTDNTSSRASLRHQWGTRSRDLYQLFIPLLDVFFQNGIWINAQHIPGKLNVRAAQLSRRRRVIQTECMLHPSICQSIFCGARSRT